MEEILTSASNPTVKRLRLLQSSSKARKGENAFIAEGSHLVSSFLATGEEPLLYAYAASAAKHPEVAILIDKLSVTSSRKVVLADSLFESITSIHASVGILIVFASPTPKSVNETNKSSAVLLENIQDPGNLGTILRTAAAVGVHSVALSSGCASPWSPKALRAGMGAQFGLAIHEDADLREFAKAAELPIFATSLEERSQSLFETDLTRPVAWLFGNEGQGVSETLIKNAENVIHIPQTSTSIESLNVSAAAAVCLYEQFRQLQK